MTGFSPRATAYAALCTAVWRSVDARAALARRGTAAAAVAHGEALAVLADRRIAHWVVAHPDAVDPLAEIDRNGLRVAHAAPDRPGSTATAVPPEHPARRYW